MFEATERDHRSNRVAFNVGAVTSVTLPDQEHVARAQTPAHIGTYALAGCSKRTAHIAGYALPVRCGLGLSVSDGCALVGLIR